MNKITANPVGPRIVHVFLANDGTEFYVEHYLVDGSGALVQGTGGVDYVLRELSSGKTGDIVNADSWVRPIATDDGNNYIFTGYDFFKDYRYPADPSVYEIYEGSISADPDAPLILRLYYGAAIQHLDFYIGDVDFDMDGNPDAEWLIDKPEADYRTGTKLTLPVAASAQRPGYTLVGWYEAPTAADGEAVSNLVGTLARDWHDTYISADFFHPVGSEWRMANHDTILYAVWRANNDTEYTVEVWVIQGDGTEDHLPQYDVNAKGITATRSSMATT